MIMVFTIMPLEAFAQTQVTMTVHNPRGNIENRPLIPLAERLPTFDGMNIVVYGVGMQGSIMARIPELLAERFGPSAHLAATTPEQNPRGVSFGVAMDKAGVDFQDMHYRYESVARAADAVVVGVAF